MTDRELLELAAKAAGLKIKSWWEKYPGEWWADLDVVNQQTDPPTTWNPLVDDGDAFRLAVWLKIRTRFTWDGCDDQHDAVWAEHGRVSCNEELGITPSGEQFDEMKATRRAIVRVAAEIGKALP